VHERNQEEARDALATLRGMKKKNRDRVVRLEEALALVVALEWLEDIVTPSRRRGEHMTDLDAEDFGLDDSEFP
jgi:hypothetical protein